VTEAGTGAVAVEFRGIRRTYGTTHALDGLDLALAPGELLALLGPSGCGKTTALRLLAGFDRPTAGTVLIGGRDVTGVPASKRDTGMVFQAYSLFPTMTAAENVAFGLRMRKVGAVARAARARELLELVGLGDRGGSYPHELSGGQQQRVALARALAVAPSVLLLDEPLSALDARVRVQLRDEIRRVQLAEGITTLFVTHDRRRRSPSPTGWRCSTPAGWSRWVRRRRCTRGRRRRSSRSSWVCSTGFRPSGSARAACGSSARRPSSTATWAAASLGR
jgi:putative spermidine/putrescine transport system ATP-binding protein